LITIFTFALAWLAYKQWGALDDQHKAMRDQADHMREGLVLTKQAADAAHLSAQAIIGAERPWVTIKWRRATSDTYQFTALNEGRTPARIMSAFCGDSFELPEIPEYGDSNVDHPILLLPDVDFFASEEATDGHPTYFWGRIIYSDALPPRHDNIPNIHETKWCFLREPFIADLTLAGPERYNDYT